MKLLDEIVSLLSDERASLNGALLKTKVLLRTIGHKELADWVNDELTGYDDDNRIPPYRKLPTRLLGNVSDGWNVVAEAYPVPVENLPDNFRDYWAEIHLREGLGALEKMLSAEGGKTRITYPLPPELYHPLSGVLSAGFHFDRVWSQVEFSQVRGILTAVRSRLLDFILTLRDEIGETMTDSDAKNAASRLDVQGMLNGAVFGDNVTILVGHNSQQHVHNINVKNDAGVLAAELRKHGVAEDDIVALDTAIAQDPVPTTAGQYGPAVQAWMSRMLGKAVDSSWKISISAAGGVLAGVIKSYYGI
jgi:hypothetical protein